MGLQMVKVFSRRLSLKAFVSDSEPREALLLVLPIFSAEPSFRCLASLAPAPNQLP